MVFDGLSEDSALICRNDVCQDSAPKSSHKPCVHDSALKNLRAESDSALIDNRRFGSVTTRVAKLPRSRASWYLTMKNIR